MKNIALIFLISFSLASCTKSLVGKGDTITETRTVTAFTGVRLEGNGNATITYSENQEVKVSGFENLLTFYKTYVDNGVLVLKFDEDHYNVRNNNINVYIKVPAIASLYINGSGKISMSDYMLGNKISATINGSGDIYCTNSKYNESRLEINGSGYLHTQEMQTKNAEAIIHGSGNIDMHCSQSLKVSISGSGDIRYWGNPTSIDTQISGSGHVSKQ